jgi:hypothetical protein
MQSRTERLARGTIAAGVATFAAALSHAAGGGLFPSAPLLALAFLASIGWCTLVVGRRFSWRRVSVAVVASQAFFHATFALVSDEATRVVADSAHGGHHGTTTLTVIAGESAHAHVGGAWMLLAHAIAALLTIAALRLGDRSSFGIAALSRLVNSLRRVVVVAVAPERHATGTRVRAGGSGFRPARAVLLLGGLRHRGPPLTTAIA